MKSTKNQDSVHQWTVELVAEFTKNRPDQQKVRKLMQQMNLPLSDDPIEQMSQCLRYMNDVKQMSTPKHAVAPAPKKERMKDL